MKCEKKACRVACTTGLRSYLTHTAPNLELIFASTTKLTAKFSRTRRAREITCAAFISRDIFTPRIIVERHVAICGVVQSAKPSWLAECFQHARRPPVVSTAVATRERGRSRGTNLRAPRSRPAMLLRVGGEGYRVYAGVSGSQPYLIPAHHFTVNAVKDLLTPSHLQFSYNSSEPESI